jgi:uncharacterized membrane protein
MTAGVDASQPSEARYILVDIGSILIAAALIAFVRGIGALVRVTARPLRRFLPHRAATALAVLVVVLLLGFLATGVLPRVAIATANSVFSGVDDGTAAGIFEPVTTLRSGSPESLVPWPTLGRQGRTFVDTGPTEAEISKFTGTPAMEPIPGRPDGALRLRARHRGRRPRLRASPPGPRGLGLGRQRDGGAG